MKRSAAIVVIVGCLLSPLPAMANMGTPLMWAGMLHLMIGNFIIGIFEGLILVRFQGPKRLPAMGLMVLANYFSAWVGTFVLHFLDVNSLPITLHTVHGFVISMIVVAYMMTLLLEFPFIAFHFRKDPAWLRKSIRNSLIIQTISYVLLFGWYWAASGTSMITRTKIVQPASITLPASMFAYFISDMDGQVYAVNLDTFESQKVFDLNSTSREDRLLVRPSTNDSTCWDLLARMNTDNNRKPKWVIIKESLTRRAAPSWRSQHGHGEEEIGNSFSIGPAAQLDGVSTNTWSVSSGYWASEGFHGENTVTKKRVHLSLETPFAAWNVRNLTQISDDKFLFQLGRDQICIVDITTMRLALIAKGRGPVAVLHDAVQ